MDTYPNCSYGKEHAHARRVDMYLVVEGVGLVVHFPLEDVAKINTP